MKYIVNESRLKKLQLSFIDEYLDDISFPSGIHDNFIIIWSHPHGEYGDDGDDILMEFDSWDGRLYIDKKFRNLIKSTFGNISNYDEAIVEWFEKKFDVKVIYTN
jgi:hypothetical protein